MKYRLLLIGLMVCVITHAQVQPPFYTKISARYSWLGGIFDHLNLPTSCGYPSLKVGQWVGDGAFILDTCNNKLYWRQNSTWWRVADTSSVAPISNLGSAYRLWKPQSPGIASLRISNGLTPDSATSGEIGVKLGGTITQNTSVSGSGWTNSLTFDGLNGVNIDYFATIGTAKIWTGFGMKNVFIGGDPVSLSGISNNDENTAVGYGALKSITTTAGNNTAMGYRALGANTDGNDNVAIGSDAMRTMTSPDKSTAIGLRAMEQAVNGTDNIAIGWETGLQMSGNQNVAIGNYSLYSATGPSLGFNTAVGDHTLFSNTTGNGNVAVGTNALLSNTTGIKNTAVGSGAAESITIGSWNTAIGQDAMLNVIDGIRNFAGGWNSGKIEKGDQNVSIGYLAGATVSVGSNGTYIGGFQTGDNALQEDTCNHCIVLGSYGFATATRQMVLGTDSLNETRIFGLNRVTSATWVPVYDSASKRFSYIRTSDLGTGGGGGSGITGFTDGNGFDGTVTGSNLSLTTTVTDDQVMFSNSGAMAGSSAFTWNGNSLKAHAASTMGVVFSAADGVENYLTAEDATPTSGEVFISARYVATNYAQMTFSNRSGGNSTIQHVGGGEFNFNSAAGAPLNLKGEGTQGIALTGSNITSSLQHQFELQQKIKDISTPSTPAAGYGYVYVNSDSLRFKNDGGEIFTLGAARFATYTDTTDKTFSAATTAEVIPLNNEDIESGIQHSGSSEEITFSTAGVYSFSYYANAQSSLSDAVKICMQKWNGSSWDNTPYSGVLINIPVSGTFSGTGQFQVNLAVADKVRFVATASSTSCTLNHITNSDGVAATPAFRVTIKKL